MIDIIVSDEYLHFKFSLCGWGDDCRSAELLVDHSPQFAAGEEAGKRLPALSDAADSLVILARFRRRNRGGCIYVVQKKSFADLGRRHRLFVGLPVTQP
ncbi:hypothetical protein ACOJBM_38505 [Rhizobium beringeri]